MRVSERVLHACRYMRAIKQNDRGVGRKTKTKNSENSKFKTNESKHLGHCRKRGEKKA